MRGPRAGARSGAWPGWLGVALLAVGLHASAAGVAVACSCLGPETTQEEYAQSAAVFIAEVLSVKRPGVRCAEGDGCRPQGFVNTVTVRVQRAWKGAGRGVTTVTTASQGPACGFGFQVGRRYLIFASRTGDGPLHVSRCSRTAALEDAKDDLRALPR